jgi:L-lysine 2,3-aminomutase
MVALTNRDTDLTVPCRLCGRTYIVNVDADDIFAWRDGENIQDALDYLTPGQRELLISGTCDSCFNVIFGLDNDE